MRDATLVLLRQEVRGAFLFRKPTIGGWVTAFVLVLIVRLPSANAQNPSLQWQQQQAPATPGNEAIIGGPGDAPEQDSPLYVCRAAHGEGLYPGKWVKGNCNIAVDGQEIVASDYEIAIGHAVWGPYQSRAVGLLQTGKDADGSTLYSCRASYRGYQPGKLKDGKCAFPYDGREIVQRPPFEALYAPGSVPSRTTAATPAPVSPSPASGPTTYRTTPPLKDRDDDDDLASPSTQKNRSCLKTAGAVRANELVGQCLKVSTATRPPCNVDNACALLRNEIKRGCAGLGADAPDFCEQYR